MTPFRSGPPQHQLLGFFHLGEPGRVRPAAVSLCNPFGQEAIRAQRTFRVLAERQTRAGMPALRTRHSE